VKRYCRLNKQRYSWLTTSLRTFSFSVPRLCFALFWLAWIYSAGTFHADIIPPWEDYIWVDKYFDDNCQPPRHGIPWARCQDGTVQFDRVSPDCDLWPAEQWSVPQSHNCADVTYDHSSLTSAQCSDLAVLQFLQRNYFCSTPSVGRQTMQLNSASNSLLSIVLMLLSESQHAGLAYVQTVDNSRSVHCCIPICWQLSRVALHSPRCTGSVHRQMSTDRHI